MKPYQLAIFLPILAIGIFISGYYLGYKTANNNTILCKNFISGGYTLPDKSENKL